MASLFQENAEDKNPEQVVLCQEQSIESPMIRFMAPKNLNKLLSTDKKTDDGENTIEYDQTDSNEADATFSEKVIELFHWIC